MKHDLLALSRAIGATCLLLAFLASTHARADTPIDEQAAAIATYSAGKLDPQYGRPATAEAPTTEPVAKQSDLVQTALSLIGVRYRWGGNTPESGLDCSGFVRYVFQNVAGIRLPRRAAEISQSGPDILTAELRPGDLVFFRTRRHMFSHVGIYIGERKFVHAPSTGSTIRVDNIDNTYWQQRFNGARRIEVSLT